MLRLQILEFMETKFKLVCGAGSKSGLEGLVGGFEKIRSGLDVEEVTVKNHQSKQGHFGSQW